jgi:hypothetical protein
MIPIYPNKDDYDENFWGKNYRVLVSTQGIEFLVNANHEGDAIDEVIDYCEEYLPGLLWTREEEMEEEFIDEYICGGNHGRYFSTYNIHIEEV